MWSTESFNKHVQFDLSEVTEDHEELLKVAPLTWKADCQVIHEADCARNVNELLEIVSNVPHMHINEQL